MKTNKKTTTNDALAAINAVRAEIESLKKAQTVAQNAVIAARKEANHASRY